MKPYRIYHVKEWETPATAYPIMTRGCAEIRRGNYEAGYYHMEGILDFDFYEVKKPIPVTQLFIKNEVWMVDDPLHWTAMQWYIDEAPGGNLVCAGLGLGLMAHIAVKYAKFTSIQIVEINSDVIDLVFPLLPVDPRLQVIHADFEDRKTADLLTAHPDCILWDLAVGDRSATSGQLARGIAQTCGTFGDVSKMFFGFRSHNGGSAFADLSDIGCLIR